jgi:hypothetical protein
LRCKFLQRWRCKLKSYIGLGPGLIYRVWQLGQSARSNKTVPDQCPFTQTLGICLRSDPPMTFKKHFVFFCRRKFETSDVTSYERTHMGSNRRRVLLPNLRATLHKIKLKKGTVGKLTNGPTLDQTGEGSCCQTYERTCIHRIKHRIEPTVDQTYERNCCQTYERNCCQTYE